MNGAVFTTLQPSTETARFASAISSSRPGPFIAAKTPFILMSGMQYSASVFMLATARAVATSNFSRSFTSRPASSARLCRNTASTLMAAQTSCRNTSRLLSESSSVSSMSGRMILTGSPGKPAPVPTSMSFAPFLISTAFKSVRLSTKCLTTASCGSVIAVRLTTSFFSSRSARYV